MADPKFRMLLGASNFTGTPYELRNPLKDVIVARRLAYERGLDVKTALAGDYTAPNLRDGLTWLKEATGPGDVACLYLDGHGTQLASDTETDGIMEAAVMDDSEFERPESFFRDVDLDDFMRGLCPMAHFTAIFDLCFSGGMAGIRAAVAPKGQARCLPNPLLAKRRGFGPRRRLLSVADPRPVVIISACAEGETASDGIALGAFTGAFAQVLDNSLAPEIPRPVFLKGQQILDVQGYPQHIGMFGGLLDVGLWR